MDQYKALQYGYINGVFNFRGAAEGARDGAGDGGGSDFWQSITPPVPEWRAGAHPTALQWLRKYLTTETKAGGEGGQVATSIAFRLFRERRVRVAHRITAEEAGPYTCPLSQLN